MASRNQYGDFKPGNSFEVQFGVEIEMVLSPKHTQTASSKDGYWREQLAALLRGQGLEAVARHDEERYRKHPEHYNKWFITTDGSLRCGRDES